MCTSEKKFENDKKADLNVTYNFKSMISNLCLHFPGNQGGLSKMSKIKNTHL